MRRASRLIRSTIEHGPQPTFLAAGAKRRGAKQKLLEFAGLVSMVRKQKPSTVVEIGTLHGGTLWAWCRIADHEATIVSIDLPGGAFGGGYASEASDRLRSYAGTSQKLHLIRGDSHDRETLNLLEATLGGRSIDLLFIDADHTYEGVRKDFETYSPLVRSGGLIAFHDVLPHADPTCEVDRFWGEVSSEHEQCEFFDIRDPTERQWGGIGVVVWRDGRTRQSI